jgi:cyclophilin family peptidyl-prolyl cis-trans isomerase
MIPAAFSCQSRTKRRRGKQAHWSRLEFLERRTLLTGNVQVQLLAGNAFLTGDSGNNSVEIVADSNNIVVRGLDGTTINGGPDVFTLSVGSTTFAGSLTAFLGAGNDLLKVGAQVSISGAVTLDGGAGNDSIGITGSTLGGGLTIRGGSGIDTISLQNSSVARSAFIYSSGAATINVSNSTIGDWLHVHTGSGADDIVLDGATVNGWTLFDTGSGDDDIVIRNSTINDRLDVFAGRGDDVAFFDGATVTGQASLWMQQGNDSVQIQGTSSFHKRLLYGGLLGRDSVEIVPPATVAKLKRLGKVGSQVSDSLIEARITNATTGAIAKAAAARAIFNPSLTLVVAADSVSESAGAEATTLTVTRIGSTASALQLALTSSNPSRATVPATATIPSGASSVTVPISSIDNAIADPDVVVTFTAVATGWNSGSDVLTVVNDDIATLTVSANPSTVSESSGAAAVTFTVSRNTSDNSQPLTVSLLSNKTNRLTVAASVVIPANASSATFTGSTVNNALVDGSAVVSISATATGFTGGQVEVTVTDDDVATLTVTSSVATVAENAANGAVNYTVSRNTADLTQPLTVNLTSGTPARLTVPETVIIPANASSVTFAGSPVNNTIADGTSQVVVSATAAGFVNGQATVTVTDDDADTQPRLTANVSAVSVSEGAAPGTVKLNITRLNSDNSQALTVAIILSDNSRISAPATATIPAGESSVVVDLSTIDNTIVDGSLLVTFSASATGFNVAQTIVMVTDDEIAAVSLNLQSTSVPETIGTLPGTVSLGVVFNSDQVVNLEYSNSAILSGPPSILIPAGASNVPVEFSVSRASTVGPAVEAHIRAFSAVAGEQIVSVTISDSDTLSLTTDISANTYEQSNGTVITRGTVFTIQGVTLPGAIITVDRDGDGQFDDGTTTAAEDGTYSVDITLIHDAVNNGANLIVVKADSGTDSSDAQVNVHLAIGTVIRFQTNLGTWDTELLDTDAPVTVQNFLNYAGATAYDDLIVHRNVQTLVVQAGAFTVSDGRLTAVPTNTPIQNEFNAANSNLRGTLSMAQLGGQPNSGTSQWFFNTADNSSLDNALHTVFGRVIGTGMTVVDQINAVTPRDLRTLYGSSALGEVPLLQFSPANTQLTGTASLSTGSAILTGTGTLFSTELQTGDSILVGTRTYFVESIESNTSLTLSAVSPETGASFNILKDVVPNDTDFIVFSDIGEILSLI